ncbi:MAG: hypothetical protein IT260_07730 [Saprospiraceae bacterium]|nr:hypothetical protein [Saprospiraceae bacterium]
MNIQLPSPNGSRWFYALLLSITLAGFGAGLSSCASAQFSQTALDNSVSLGKDLPVLMNKATKAYSDNETEANALLAKVNDAYTLAASFKKNKDVAEQWRILRDDLVQPFLTRWKEKGKLDKDFIRPAAEQVKSALGAIERAEKAKPK